jgi:protein-L-isoaspartate(D-aspartate) O-methyltransferase
MNYLQLRKDMITEQLIPRGITEKRILEAFSSVPREEFVSGDLRPMAYSDSPLPAGNNQTISQPYMVALMTQLILPKQNDKILEVGTGSGYQAAILARLAKRVYSVERFSDLAEAARKRFKKMKIDNVEVICGDGSLGLPAEAPFEGVVVTAAAPKVPKSLKNQLAEGGRLVIPVGQIHMQSMLKVTRQGKEFIEDYYDNCVFVPLVGKEGWTSTNE